MHQLRQRVHRRTCAFIGQTDGGSVVQAGHDGRCHIVHPHRLEARTAAGQRQHRRHRLQRGEEVQEAVFGPEDDRGPQQREVDCRRAQCGLAGGLAAQVMGRRGSPHAQGADVNHAAHAGGRAGLRQAARQLDMHALEGRRVAVQDGNQVDDRRAAGHQRRQLRVVMDVGLHHGHRGQRAHGVGVLLPARRHGDGGAGTARRQAGANGAPDEAGAAQNQDVFRGCRHGSFQFKAWHGRGRARRRRPRSDRSGGRWPVPGAT